MAIVPLLWTMRFTPTTNICISYSNGSRYRDSTYHRALASMLFEAVNDTRRGSDPSSFVSRGAHATGGILGQSAAWPCNSGNSLTIAQINGCV